MAEVMVTVKDKNDVTVQEKKFKQPWRAAKWAKDNMEKPTSVEKNRVSNDTMVLECADVDFTEVYPSTTPAGSAEGFVNGGPAGPSDAEKALTEAAAPKVKKKERTGPTAEEKATVAREAGLQAYNQLNNALIAMGPGEHMATQIMKRGEVAAKNVNYLRKILRRLVEDGKAEKINNGWQAIEFQGQTVPYIGVQAPTQTKVLELLTEKGPQRAFEIRNNLIAAGKTISGVRLQHILGKLQSVDMIVKRGLTWERKNAG